MVRAICKDYGFDCEFMIDDLDMEKVVQEFGKHLKNEHGIEYGEETLTKFMLNVNS